MKIKKGVVIQKLGDSFVAYDNNTSYLHEFNETGFLILSQIEAGKSENKILSLMVKTYNITSQKAKRDLESFIKELFAKDIIVKGK